MPEFPKGEVFLLWEAALPEHDPFQSLRLRNKMKNRHLLTLTTLGLLAVGTCIQAQTIIYSDWFTAADGTVILGYSPETNNGVVEATYHESNNVWTTNSAVGIFENRAQLGADNQANLPINSSGDFVQPELIGVSVVMNMGTTDGPTTAITTGEQRGVGLGFFSGTSNLATPEGFRGLVITTDGRLILAEHGFGGSARAGFIEEIATDIDTASDHTLSFQINTTTGAISNIFLDGAQQPDVETSIFNLDINHVGFMVSSAAGGTTATYDDFTVIRRCWWSCGRSRHHVHHSHRRHDLRTDHRGISRNGIRDRGLGHPRF